MNALELLLETTPMRALGWTLVHFVWQGVALFVVHELLQVMLRKRSASARYVASCFVLVSMMASAGLTMRLEMQNSPVGIGNVLARTTSLESPVQSVSEDTAREGATPPAVASKVSDPHISHHRSCPQDPCKSNADACNLAFAADAPKQEAAALGTEPSDKATPAGRVDRFRALAVQPLNFLHVQAPRLETLLPWLVSLWLAGVFLLTTRLAIGWQEARWLRSRAVRPVRPSTGARFHELLEQLRISRPVQVLESALAEVPTVVGWLRPVVLLPTAAVTGLPPRHLEALIAHELTHVKRHDYLINLIQTMVETLLFYHPAVWWVSNRIRDERENCCDDVAVQVCGNAVVYARALTNMEELRSGALRPELAMAADGGSLIQRVRRLVGRGGEPTTPGAGVVVGAILVALTSLLAVSAGRTTETGQAWPPLTTSERTTTLETDNLGGKIAGIQEAQPASQLPRPGAVSGPAESQPNPQPKPQPVFQLDEIVRMKQFGVDVEFYDEMTELLGDLEVDELVALKMHDVDRHFAEEMRPLFGELASEDLIALKMHNVNVEYVNGMSALFDEELELEEAVHLRQQGIRSSDVEKILEQGVGLDAGDAGELQELLGPLSIEQSMALLAHGIDAHEIEALQDMGMYHPDPETLIHMYTMGLSADVIDTILDDEMEDVSVEALLLFKELGLEDVFLEEFRRRNP